MIDYSVNVATKAEIEAIVSEPQIASKLPNTVEYILASSVPYYIIRYKEYSLLLSLSSVSAGVLEVHVACPAASIVASRILALLGFKWAASNAESKVHTLLTTAPAGKIANFAKKVGFVEYERTETLIKLKYLIPRG